MSELKIDTRLWSSKARNLSPYVPGEQPQHENLCKLNTNENPFPPSPKVGEAIAKVLAQQADELRLYPAPESDDLRAALAELYNLDINQVFVGNGSDEVLALVFASFFLKERPILAPDISYSFYPVYSQLFSVNSKILPLNDNFEIVIEDYQQPNGGIILTNPNAPTSIALGVSAIEQVLKANPDSVVVIDEAYVDFGAESAVSLVKKYQNLVVCQTTSKSRSLAGLRVGFAIAQPHLIAALEAVKNSFNSYPIDRFAIAAAVASFEDQAYFEAHCQKVIDNREALVMALDQLGFKVLPSKANFIFASHPDYDAAELATQLREQGIIVRYFNQPRIDQYLRITIGTDEQNQRLVDTLKHKLFA